MSYEDLISQMKKAADAAIAAAYKKGFSECMAESKHAIENAEHQGFLRGMEAQRRVDEVGRKNGKVKP